MYVDLALREFIVKSKLMFVAKESMSVCTGRSVSVTVNTTLVIALVQIRVRSPKHMLDGPASTNLPTFAPKENLGLGSLCRFVQTVAPAGRVFLQVNRKYGTLEDFELSFSVCLRRVYGGGGGVGVNLV